jgi:phosphonatase-like hydrolase
MTTDLPPVRLAVLDMAGTTVSDGGIVEEAFLRALESIDISRDDPATDERLAYVRATMGESKISVFRALLHDEDRARAAVAGFESAVAEQIGAGRVAALPGARGAIDALREAGVAVCLTTGFSPDTQTQILDALDWHDAIDLALAPVEGIRGRPHPDLALAALMRLELDDVREVATAGDTVTDVLAGHRAGASVVAGVLTGAHSRDDLSATPHTHLLESVAQLPAALEGRLP